VGARPRLRVEVTPEQLEQAFPELARVGYRITSPATQDYNCIALAAGDTENFWWPSPPDETFWPASAPRQLTLNAFIAAYGTLGYTLADSGAREDGLEKLAIYVNDSGEPTHAARQLADGTWTSKLGRAEDVCHLTVEGVEGAFYGRVGCFLARRRI
jgi:hypothetical protein